MATTPITPAVHQVNLPFSYYRRSKGTSLPRWRRGTVHRREILRSLAKPNGRSTSCAFAFHTPTHRRNRKERRHYQAYSLFL